MRGFYKTSAILTSAGLMLLPFFASAIVLVPCSGPDCTVCLLFLGVKNIINFLTLILAMPLAVVILIYGGVMLLTSAGSEDKIKKGKTAIWMAVWGLVIVLAAWLIIDTILKALVEPGKLARFWERFSGCP